ncbi:hypothetical protein [Kribbella speibonae]|uniref:Uncharacterized protein n=1 Tax=Kribbella speibonae TaxID=1572660 RepID=A0A4R0IWF0_9ACTN|nr:hypothetical protein [Kribbella speibonae]TCC38303.1 hypothetical protein E0H92_17855 [Kribbella speibonae]
MSKFLGFLLGVAVALAGPAVFGVLAAPGGIELNAKGMALAFGIGALVFWAVVSYFSGAGALGAFIAFGVLIYCWLWIPNRTTNFLNDVPGVTNGMIDGSKQYTLNGVVPILGVISLVYAIQLIVQGVQRRRRERVEADRLQREQEAAQAQQEADVAAVYPVAGGTYQAPAAYESHTRYDDLFDEPAAAQPRNQADDQTRQFPVGEAEEFEHTRQFPEPDAESNYTGEDTVIAPPPAPEEPVAQQEPVAQTPPAAEVNEPAEETQPVETKQAVEPKPEAVTPAEETQPVKTEPQAAAPVEETQPMDAAVEEAQPTEAKPDATEPAEDTQPVEAKPQAVEETQPVEVKPQVSEKAEPVEEKKMERGEKMGSQYRERMEDPEDTGEFHLAFENPVVKPA